MSNQTISVDRALYRMNRALQKLAPELAISEETALNLLYESTGMKPFFQDWPRHDWGRETAFADYPFYVVSYKGLTKGEPRINQIVPRGEAYRKVKELLPTDARLPMEPEHEDFGWADEDVAVFAVKHGDTRINGSFFLSRDAVFPIGRIHFTTPRIERLATVKVDTVVSPSGGTFTMPEKLPGKRKSVLGGQQYPIQPPPPGLVQQIKEADGELWRDGDERTFMADRYRIRFGDYLIAMNTTIEGTYREQTFEIDVPPGRSTALDLISGRTIDVSRPITLGPRSTIVLYLGDEKPPGDK